MSTETDNTVEDILAEDIMEDILAEDIVEDTVEAAVENIPETIAIHEVSLKENQDIQLWEPPDTSFIEDFASNQLESDPLLEEQPNLELEEQPDPELPHEVEMSFFDHLEELRTRILYALIAVVLGALGCFTVVRQLVALLEIPAKGVKFLQLTPGEYFFVSIKVAGYGGILVATPVILYQVIQFVLPGLTQRERKLVLPVVVGSSFLFVGGLAFAYYLLIPAALNFLVSYGADVVEQFWSIERYFEFILVLLLATGLLFQVPVVQILLALLGLVTSSQMLKSWRTVVVSAMVIGAVVTPSTDPITQSLLAGAVLGLYFGGVGCVKLLGK
jgi:sec-independent protein translocase protein TatC